MPHYPEAEELLKQKTTDRSGEVLLEVKMSLLSVLTYIFWAILLSILIAVISFFIPGAFFVGIPIYWFGLIPIGIGLEILRRRYDSLYIIADDKITHSGGRLSLRYKRPVMSYEHIVLVIIDQDLMGRIFGYGNIQLSSAAEDGHELVLTGIRNPHGLAKLIEGMKLISGKGTGRNV